MKKYILLTMLLIFLIGIKINASTWSYKWENTIVEVPVGSSIYDYENVPKAKLYRDNIELTDAEIKIVTTGDWLYYLTYVNTNVIGEYNVWYKAFEYKYMPGTCHDYKCLITFKVVDNEKPKINPILNNIRIERGTKSVDLSSYFNITDNYDKELKIDYFQNINTSMVGIYECEVVATDDSGNEEKHKFNVEVYNNGTPPKIEMLVENIRIKKDSKVELEKYFTVTDDDLDEVEIDISKTVNSSIPGTYKCEISAFDGYETTRVEFEVEVYDDNKPPTISKLVDIIKIEYGSDFNLSDYFIIDDDYDNKVKVVFTDNINIHNLGEYQCKVIAIDSSGLQSELDFTVEVYGDVTPPVIEQQIEKIRIKRKSSYDLEKYFLIYDESGEKLNINFFHQIDVDSIGIYECKLVVIDYKNNSSIHTFEVEVYDDIAPTIVFMGEGNSLNIYLNQYVDVKSYFKANDDIDGDITNNLIFPAINKKIPAIIDYTVSASDYAGNMSEITIKINIIDDIIPEILLYNDSITLEYGFDLKEFDYLKHVKYLLDNNEVLDKSLIDVDSNLSNKVGNYSIIYSFSDGPNTVIKELSIIVLSSKAPIINVPPITIIKNDIVNLKEKIEVLDDSDSLVFESLEVDEQGIDYTKPGKYQATAYACNSSGLTSTVTFYVIVEEENIFNNDIVKYASIGLIALLVISVGVIYYKKNKNTKIV